MSYTPQQQQQSSQQANQQQSSHQQPQYRTNTGGSSHFPALRTGVKMRGNSSNNTNAASWILKCTDVPQFDALQAQADLFRTDDKLHLRNLCSDTARCASLLAIHTSRASYKPVAALGVNNNPKSGGSGSGSSKTTAAATGATGATSTTTTTTSLQGFQHKMILDYSRQRVTGETMEQLFDLADAVGLAERCWAFKEGAPINATEGLPVLHHVLRMPAYYKLELSESVGEQRGDTITGNINNTAGGGAMAQLSPQERFQQQQQHEQHIQQLNINNSNTNTTQQQQVAARGNMVWGREPSNPYLMSPLSSSQQQQQPGPMDGRTVLRKVHKLRSRVQEYAYRVRSGDITSVTGQHTLKNTIVIATGGTHLGTESVATALAADPVASAAAGAHRKLRFVSHNDPVNFYTATRDLNPAETLLIIISPTFATSTDNNTPVLLNARTALEWLVHGIQAKSNTATSTLHHHHHHGRNAASKFSKGDIVAKHVLAITQDHPSTLQRCREWGISSSNIFALPNWVKARYSVCSVVGLLPLSLQYSYPVMSDFLDGAHDMDEHFFHAPLRENIPVILGLLGVWNSTFLGYNCRCLLPFADALQRFPAYVQHVDMESNGKRVALDGTPLLHRSGEIDFGESGAQHSFFQLLHQGRVVPADFIGFMENPQPADLQGEAVSNHDELMSHFFAQPDALAYGKTLVDLVQEGTPEPLREHMAYSGNRPSSSLLLTRLDAFAMGQLVALFEHRTAVQGFVWGINSFDQFGLELGAVSAKHVRAQLSASRKTGASVQGFNASTSTLLEHYLANEKQQRAAADMASSSQPQQQPENAPGRSLFP